jgi:hypothetical protein
MDTALFVLICFIIIVCILALVLPAVGAVFGGIGSGVSHVSRAIQDAHEEKKEDKQYAQRRQEDTQRYDASSRQQARMARQALMTPLHLIVTDALAEIVRVKHWDAGDVIITEGDDWHWEMRMPGGLLTVIPAFYSPDINRQQYPDRLSLVSLVYHGSPTTPIVSGLEEVREAIAAHAKVAANLEWKR